MPLALFGIVLPGVLGLSEVWGDQFRDTFARHFTPSVFVAIDTTVVKIMTEESRGLPIFAGLLLLWYVSGLVRACIGGMNSIYEADDERPLLERWGLSLALAVAVTIAVVLAVLAVTVGPRIEGSGPIHVLLLVFRWPIAVAAIGLAVGLLVRYGPAESRHVRWASVGAGVVVAAWIVEALLFAWYVDSYADFTSASGTLTVFLLLAGFLYTASVIFLVGVEIDELLRKDASPDERGIIAVLRRGMRGSERPGNSSRQLET